MSDEIEIKTWRELIIDSKKAIIVNGFFKNKDLQKKFVSLENYQSLKTENKELKEENKKLKGKTKLYACRCGELVNNIYCLEVCCLCGSLNKYEKK